MSSTFVSMSNKDIALEINKAEKHLFYAAPGIFKFVAEAIIDLQKNRNVSIDLVIDPDPEICRLGYGEISAIELLQKTGISIRKSSGLRICILIVDNNGWFFNLPPQCVEKEPTPDQVNAIRLSTEQIESMRSSLGFQYLYSEQHGNPGVTSNPNILPEMGKDPLSVNDVQKALEDLNERPPEKFDIRRQISVYHSYIQFVEIHLDGCDFHRHKVQLPQEILNQSWGKELKDRMQTSISLLTDNPKIAPTAIKTKFERLKKDFLRPTGQTHGNIILIKHKKKFEEGIRTIDQEIKEFQKKQIEIVTGELNKTVEAIIKRFLPILKKKPPEEIRQSFLYDSAKEDHIHEYLYGKLLNVFPSPDKFLSKIRIRYTTKDATYETLKDPAFQEKIKAFFPRESWVVPISETTALGEREELKESLS